MNNEKQMAQMQAMMQSMASGEKKEKDTGRTTEIVEGESTSWGDGRMSGRFSRPSKDPFHQDRGQDPLKKVLHRTRGANKSFDMNDIHQALFAPPIFDSNFQPVNEVLSHPSLSDHEKVMVLKKCLEFGADTNARDSNKETSFRKAVRLKEPDMAKSAAIALIEHGLDLNVMDKDGRKPLHYAMEAGLPELIPALIARQATAGKTVGGLTLGHMALAKFQQTMITNASNDPGVFEKALDTYYKSMSYVKRYKLHQDEFNLDGHRQKLLEVCKSQPGYRKFVDDVEQKIHQIEPLEQAPKARQIRAFTNPGYGFNYKVEDDAGAHPWLTGFSSFMDKMASKLAKGNYLIRSQNRIEELLKKPHLLNNEHVLRNMQIERKTFDLDHVVGDKKINPFGDTLLTRIARNGDIDGISNLVELNANLNARDIQGNTAMHLLVQQCNNKEHLLIGLKHLVGIPTQEGKITTLGGHNNYADRDIMNSKGQTFMDVLAEKHPEWVNEFTNEIHAFPINIALPDLEISKTLLLEGPDAVLRLSKNSDPFLITDESIPTIRKLDSVASDQERTKHVLSIAQDLVRIQALKQVSPEKTTELNNAAEQILYAQDPDIKMKISILFAQDDAPNSNKLNAQAMVLQNLGHAMRNGNDIEKSAIFDTFERADVDLQYRITALLRAQSVTMAGEKSTVGETDQEKFNVAVAGLQNAATMFESQMANQARVKYGINDVSINNENKPKG